MSQHGGNTKYYTLSVVSNMAKSCTSAHVPIKMSLPVGSGNTWFRRSKSQPLNGISINVVVFAQRTRVPSTDRQTRTHTTLRATSVAIVRIYSLQAQTVGRTHTLSLTDWRPCLSTSRYTLCIPETAGDSWWKHLSSPVTGDQCRIKGLQGVLQHPGPH